MKDINEHELKLLRHRFCEDTGTPIQVLTDPYFTERLELFDKEYNTLSDYKTYMKYIEETFGNNVTEFLEYYHSLRDKIIGEVSNSESFRRFQEDKKITEEIKSYTPVIGCVNLYTQEQMKENGNYYLSIDMKKANFQTLKWIDPAIVYDCDTYEDFVGRFTDMEWAKKSKRTREIIFGKMNPNRTMKYEKILIGEVEKYIRTTVIPKYFDLFSLNSDELIYKMKSGLDFDKVTKTINDSISEESLFGNTNLHLRLELFKLVCYNFKTSGSDKIMNVFVKEHTNGTKTYKCANEIYFPQTYKLINKLEINENDLVFYYDKTELAKFFKPIELVKNKNE